MENNEKDTYVLTFDFRKEETNSVVFFENVINVLGGFEDFNKVICKGIDSEIAVSSYLIDVQSGSIKLRLKDIISKIPDDLLKDITDPKALIGHFLVGAKYKALKLLDDTKALPALDRETKIYDAICEEVKSLPVNPLMPSNIDKSELLSTISTISQAAKNIDKVSFGVEGQDVVDVEVIDVSFSYKVPPAPTKMVQVISAELIVKKPDLLGSSKWEFVFDKNISATVEDTDFLSKIKNKEIGFFCDDKVKAKMRIEVSLNERQEVLDTKYFIEQIEEVIRAIPQEKQGNLI